MAKQTAIQAKTAIKAMDVANYLLCWANKNGDLITNLKMQKLLYYAQAWYLVNHKAALFSDPIEAWEYGPVVPEVYRKFKKFGARSIEYKETGKEENIFSEMQLNYLNDFSLYFMKYPAYMLVNATHNEAPWKDAFKANELIISIEAIQKYFSSLSRKHKK
jgi:uncharacterized phage-associated protein